MSLVLTRLLKSFQCFDSSFRKWQLSFLPRAQSIHDFSTKLYLFLKGYISWARSGTLRPPAPGPDAAGLGRESFQTLKAIDAPSIMPI